MPDEKIKTAPVVTNVVEAASSRTDDAVRRGVARWVDENLRNTPFSQDTGAWNVLQGAIPKLAPIIAGELN